MAGELFRDQAPTEPFAAQAHIHPGQRIGRFHVLEILGRGGMGLVISAYDPGLDRRVAIKLVRAGGPGPTEQDEVKARLLREARAMAQLRHENVVTVYEAGTHEGMVYLAMEQVEGGTLRDELGRLRAGGEIGWRAVVDLFVAAGRGLAAAHRAGFIHRDFKPDNILVGQDGRVLVGDFGVVSFAGPASANAGGEAGVQAPVFAGEDGVADPGITRADLVVGTPNYMAPEQHFNQPLDARADQFGFCVALWEALHGRLPFSGADRKDYVTAICAGAVEEPPPGARVPSWVQAVLRRGLDPDPGARYPSMDALLAEFDERDVAPARESRKWMAFAYGVGFGAISFVGAALGGFETYTSLVVAHVVALALLGVGTFVVREAVARSLLNRQLLLVILLVIVADLLLLYGSWRLEIGAYRAEIFFPAVWSACSAVLVATLDRRLFPMPVGYALAFLAAVTFPELRGYFLGVSHAVAVATVVLVLTGETGEGAGAGDGAERLRR